MKAHSEPTATVNNDAPIQLVPSDRIRLQGVRRHAIETGRNRLVATGVLFAMAFLVIAGRLLDLAILSRGAEPTFANAASGVEPATIARAAIVDRNGVLLATTLPTQSVYADAREIQNPQEAAERLAAVLPGLDQDELAKKLASKRPFLWIHRNLTPHQHYQVNKLGIPGLYFQRAESRVYPQGNLAAHILGLTNLDGRGIAGVEKYFDEALRAADEPLRLSIDIRVQDILTQELQAGIDEFQAIGAAGVIMDVRTGEILAMTSLPDFDPNDTGTMTGDREFNRATKGVYEMGSTFKLFTAATALDSGTTKITDRYDATKPIHVARFTISDYHGENRWLTVPEILIHSSNIGSAKMALEVGSKTQQDYLRRLGLLTPASLELPEIGSPLTPTPWRDINTMTISYGHGIAVSPLQLTSAVSTLVNGGIRVAPTLMARDDGRRPAPERVLSDTTSKQMRQLMRLVVTEGTGTNADVPGYRVGGKTGTADKEVSGSYDRRARISSFVAAFPMDDPRYAVLAVFDEPQGNKRTFGYATGGWVAAPAIARIVSHMAPLVGIAPTYDAIDPADPAGRQPDTQLAAVRKVSVAAR